MAKEEKTNLHPRNKNRNRYDLEAMLQSSPALAKVIQVNKSGEQSINFADPTSVKILNRAILKHYYSIDYWEFPDENLCPPIPGRADYIHHVADLLAESNHGTIPKGDNITCLDIGTGASCIYPIIGVAEYNLNFIASDIDSKSLDAANKIAEGNPSLKNKIVCREQTNPQHIFRGILKEGEKIDVSICNPPFHKSIEDAMRGSKRKVQNLTGKKIKSPKLNFSGNKNELVYSGGEFQFIANMIYESKNFVKNCFWHTTLVSKESNLKGLYKVLEKSHPTETKTISIKTGNKVARILAWTYLTKTEMETWAKNNWT